MRSLASAAVAASLLAAPLAPPAAATTTAVVLTCDIGYWFYGGTQHRMQGNCTSRGTHNGDVLLDGWLTTAFGLCPVTSSFQGVLIGSGISVNMFMTRVSAAGVVTVSGTTVGAGTAVFTDPCSAASPETAVIVVAGV